jgi:hypothetical protein
LSMILILLASLDKASKYLSNLSILVISSLFCRLPLQALLPKHR